MTDHTRTEKIGGDSIVLFLVFQVERETVMTAWRLHWRLRESDQYFVICLFFMLLRMLNLSVFYFCDVFVASFIYVLIIMVLFIILLVNKSRSSFRTHSRAFCIT